MALFFRRHILPTLLWLLYRVWSSSWRVQVVESEELKEALRSQELVTFAIWHGDELALLRFAHKYRVATMVSTSADGELMDRILHRFGFVTSRGSSTRGGTRALVGLLKLARTGRNPVVAVDGPKGPLHKAKPGVFEISKKTGSRIFPGGIATSKRFVFKKSWNKTYLPLPFAKVTLFWGKPLEVPNKDTDSRDQRLAQSLESALATAGYEASKLIASTPP